ncbi:flagellar hook-length control protein FliK [Saccharibacillus deserti]|uniref:flagellar hook-length control protein FliK n=1 Tax=Saccharibacillus deserti TaxID=1634444 RepID=UPI0015516693|nr:flagellar hook-length control protein FliK [Saccharibacillus deserti]
MGMTIPGMTVAASAPAAGGKATAAAAGSGAAAVFGQSLQQLMGASAAGTASGETAETPTNPLLSALQQLIAAAAGTAEDGSGSNAPASEELDVKLEELMKQLDTLDEQLTENPELMSMLQGWIQQAQTLLNPQNESAEQEGGQLQTENTLESLSSNPSTLKFALQDAVAQLIELQQATETAPQLKVQAGQALAALEDTIQTAENKIQQSQVKTAPVLQAMEAAAIQEETQPAKTEQSSVKPAGDSTIVSSKNQSQPSGNGTQQDGQASEEAPQEFKLQGTITAGELALRTNGLMPAKPVEAVPVHRMAQEVEKLVVDRLEILQKQGFTEAKISLTPDHLGKVDIRITMHAGQLVAHFVTEHAAAKDMLEQQMVQLRGSLQGQGLTVERLEVTQSSSLQSQMDQNGGQANSGQQQGRRSRTREEANDDARLTAELGEELGEWLRQKTAAQSGSSFIAEA